MKFQEVRHFGIGPRLTFTFAVLIALILGGNALLVWQFHIARLHTDRLTGVSQQLIAVLRLQESLLSFHQRLDELAQSKDAHRLVTEVAPLRRTLLDQVEQTRAVLADLPPEAPVDTAFLPTLEATEVTLPSQLEVITSLAISGDWEAVRLRVANELKPLEIQTSALVNSIDHEVSGEMTQAVANMRNVQRRILIMVPAIAISTFLIAALFGWAIAQRVIDLRLQERVGERTRITRELHDTFLQTIQGSKLVADDALERSSDPVRMRRAMEQLSLWLGQATQEGRAALNSLRTSTTQTNDLAESFQRAVEDCRIQGFPEAVFVVEGTATEMHPIVRDEIYRIGYEAIRNVCQHSAASRMDVRLSYSHDLALTVSDNGRGIDPDIAAQGRTGHFGLQGMRERALRIDGKLNLASSPDSGTRIELIVPGRIVFRGRRPMWWTLFTSIKEPFRRPGRSNGVS
jgi:signal transduction histidine kinase